MKQLIVSNASLVLAFVLVIVAMLISTKEKLHLSKDIIYSILRAVIQLTIIGYVLKYIFRINHVWLTIVMCLLIVINASWNAHKRNPNASRGLRSYGETFIALFISTFVTLGLIIVTGSLKLVPSQIIPITGMIAGNSMVAVGLCYRTLFASFRDQRQQIMEKLALGADTKAASLPILRESIKTAMQPTIDQAKTVGLVNLPGMMSGLIFAGVDPVRAIRYQILITFMLLSTTSLGAIIAGYQAYRSYFNKEQQLI